MTTRSRGMPAPRTRHDAGPPATVAGLSLAPARQLWPVASRSRPQASGLGRVLLAVDPPGAPRRPPRPGRRRRFRPPPRPALRPAPPPPPTPLPRDVSAAVLRAP